MLNEELEYLCSDCGSFFPAGTERCPQCRKEFDLEEETIEDIHQDVALFNKLDSKDAEVDMKTSTEEKEGLPKKSHDNEHGTSTKGKKKVLYRQVKE